MTEYRMLGPDECPDHRLSDEVNINGRWQHTVMYGDIEVKNCACDYRRPIKQEEKPVSEFRVGDIVKIARKVEPDGWFNVWVRSMDATVGKLGEIKHISLRVPNQYTVEMLDGSDDAKYPKEALELVSGNDAPTDDPTSEPTSESVVKEPVVKEPSPQVYDWVAFSGEFYALGMATEEEALEWFEDYIKQGIESGGSYAEVSTLYRSHATATIQEIVEISVKSVDAAE